MRFDFQINYIFIYTQYIANLIYIIDNEHSRASASSPYCNYLSLPGCSSCVVAAVSSIDIPPRGRVAQVHIAHPPHGHRRLQALPMGATRCSLLVVGQAALGTHLDPRCELRRVAPACALACRIVLAEDEAALAVAQRRPQCQVLFGQLWVQLPHVGRQPRLCKAVQPRVCADAGLGQRAQLAVPCEPIPCCPVVDARQHGTPGHPRTDTHDKQRGTQLLCDPHHIEAAEQTLQAGLALLPEARPGRQLAAVIHSPLESAPCRLWERELHELRALTVARETADEGGRRRDLRVPVHSARIRPLRDDLCKGLAYDRDHDSMCNGCVGRSRKLHHVIAESDDVTRDMILH
eukprot:scaffold1311_cov121-Isochrysis_galbana.AAC.8